MSLTPRLDRLEENIFINGGMRIAQRSAASPVPIGFNTYTSVDRWFANSSGVTSPTVRRTGPIGFGSPFISNYTQGLNGTINSSTDYFRITQRVEASRLRALMSGQNLISGSVTLAASVDADLRIFIQYPPSEDTWTSSTVIYDQTFSISGHTIQVFENITLPDIALNNGIQVTFEVTNWAATGAQFVDISDAMLNPGSRVADFNQRDLGTEIFLCKRYFQKTWQLETGVGAATTTGRKVIGCFMGSATIIGETTVQLQQTMRTLPNVTLYDSGGTTPNRLGWTTRLTSAALHPTFNIVRVTEDHFNIETSAVSGGGRGEAAELLFHYTADAEL